MWLYLILSIKFKLKLMFIFTPIKGNPRFLKFKNESIQKKSFLYFSLFKQCVDDSPHYCEDDGDWYFCLLADALVRLAGGCADFSTPPRFIAIDEGGSAVAGLVGVLFAAWGSMKPVKEKLEMKYCTSQNKITIQRVSLSRALTTNLYHLRY